LNLKSVVSKNTLRKISCEHQIVKSKDQISATEAESSKNNLKTSGLFSCYLEGFYPFKAKNNHNNSFGIYFGI